MANDDAVLLARALDGDENAFAALVARHVVWAGCAAACSLHSEAVETVVTAAFHQAWRSLDRLPRAEGFAHWLLQLLRREIDLQRRRHPHTALQPQPPSPGEWMLPEEQRLQAFVTLSQEERELLNIIQEAEVGYENACAILNCSRPALEKRLLAARRRFAQALQQRQEATPT